MREGLALFREVCIVSSPAQDAGIGWGWVAQLVEQRTENPRVGGSIPSPATAPNEGRKIGCFYQLIHYVASIEKTLMTRTSTSSKAIISRAGAGRSFAVALPLPQQIERIRAGLGFHELEKLQKALGVTLEKIGNALGMSRATLHRRKIQRRLDAEESEKLVRYQRLLAKAAEVFGSPDNAREWLTHAQRGLGEAIPLEFAKSEIGAREVENLLGRIEYGVYS